MLSPKRGKRNSLPCGTAAYGSGAMPSKTCPGKPVHSGEVLRCAYHRRPRLTSSTVRVYWHLADKEAIADAAEFSERIKLQGATPETQEFEGWVPSYECLCTAPDDVYALSERDKKRGRTAAAMCVRCGLMDTKGARDPGRPNHGSMLPIERCEQDVLCRRQREVRPQQSHPQCPVRRIPR